MSPQVERGDPPAGAVGAAEGAERGGRVHGGGGAPRQRRAYGRRLPATAGRCPAAAPFLAVSEKGSFWMMVPPACAGPVPSGPGGGAIGPGLGHHAPHCYLHPLRFHRGCQSATGASIQRRIAVGELGQIKYGWLFFLFFLMNRSFFRCYFSSVSVLKLLSPTKFSD